MKVVYTTKVTASGGRNGHVQSEDGLLDLALSMPKNLGGTGKATNPEQLFAAGYAACFENAVLHVASRKKQKLTKTVSEAEVSLGTLDDGRFNIAVKLNLILDGVTGEEAADLIREAHRVCPYSNATRGNIAIEISHRGEKVV